MRVSVEPSRHRARPLTTNTRRVPALGRPCQKLASRPRRFCGPRSSGAFRPFPPSTLGQRRGQAVGRGGGSIILIRDPIRAITQSSYGYVGTGNSLNGVDPLGLWSWRKTLGVVGAVAGAVAVGTAIVAALPIEVPAAVGVGLVAGAVAVGAGAAASAIDCSRAVDADCVIGAAGTILGTVSLGLGIAAVRAATGQWGELGQFFREGLDLYGAAAGAMSGVAGFFGLRDPHGRVRQSRQCPEQRPRVRR
jgi:hypothetical protein